MLFHITHTHGPENCPFHDKAGIEATYAKAFKRLSGGDDLKLVGLYVDAPAHKVFITLDAVSMEAIEDALDPIIDRGVAEVRPVVDGKAILQRRMAQA